MFMICLWVGRGIIAMFESTWIELLRVEAGGEGR